MNTTVKSLQDVYVSMGGQLTDTYEDIAGGIPVSDYVTNPDVIAALARIAGSTIELPGVSESDNGDVLTVIGGKWGKGEPQKDSRVDDLLADMAIAKSKFSSNQTWSNFIGTYEYGEDYTYLGRIGKPAFGSFLAINFSGDITDLRMEMVNSSGNILFWFKEVTQDATNKCFKDINGNYLFTKPEQLSGKNKFILIDLEKSGISSDYWVTTSGVELHEGGQGNPGGTLVINNAYLLADFPIPPNVYCHRAKETVNVKSFSGKLGLHIFPYGFKFVTSDGNNTTIEDTNNIQYFFVDYAGSSTVTGTMIGTKNIPSAGNSRLWFVGYTTTGYNGDPINYPTEYTVLTRNNTGLYTPSGDYNPATKKYVDDAITALRNELTTQ